MKNLQMPRSYISVSEEELRSISGGGPLGDALDLFFSNLRLDDLFFSGGLISLSFTFVPMLFFRMIKVGVQTGIKLYQQFARLLGVTSEAATTTVQYLDSIQQQRKDRPVTNSLPQPFSLQQ